MKKYQVTLLVLLAVAAAITVGCGDSTPAKTIPAFTKVPFISNRTVDPATALFVANLDLTSAAGIATNNGTWTYSPSTSADLKVVIYTSDSEIWSTSTTGSSPVQLTSNIDNGFYSFFAKVSPDGTKVMYSLWDGNNYHMWTMNPDGTGAVDLTTTPPAGTTDCYTGSFSPDSSKIAFSCYGSTSGTPTGGIFYMNADGTGSVTTVFTEVNSFLDSPSFTPDGLKMVFVDFGNDFAAARRNIKTFPHHAFHPHAVPGTTQTLGVVSVNLDGTSLTSLVPTSFEAEILNSTLYYTFYNSDLGFDQIFMSNLDGSGAVSLSDGTTEDYLGVSD